MEALSTASLKVTVPYLKLRLLATITITVLRVPWASPSKTLVQADNRDLLDRTLCHFEALVITSSYRRATILPAAPRTPQLEGNCHGRFEAPTRSRLCAQGGTTGQHGIAAWPGLGSYVSAAAANESRQPRRRL
jgi:hypothetical protein